MRDESRTTRTELPGHVEPGDRHDLDVEAEAIGEPEQLDVERVALRRLQERQKQRRVRDGTP